MEYEAVIGLEVHSQLKTESKIFCGCSTQFGDAPNSNICPVCTGQPGVLPVLNRKVVELIVRTGLAARCKIAARSVFARKHYFYPDLPKNYQISQYEEPVCSRGSLDIDMTGTGGYRKKIGITRIHLEEDAGKLLHSIGSRAIDGSLVDYNRTGIPLMEIVSEPDLNTPDECYEYLVRLKQLLEYIDVSDCNMEEGKLRCDANISVRKKGERTLGVKAELKNMNSFKAVREAVEFEISRQIETLSSGGKITQETRLWNADDKVTEVMRTKEQAHDYRYFPEPDLVPLSLEKDYIDAIRASVGELPEEKRRRYMDEFKLSEYDAGVITSSKDMADYFESTLTSLSITTDESRKTAANYIISDIPGRLNKKGLGFVDSPIDPKNLADMILRITDGSISGKMAKTVLDEVFESGESVGSVIKEKGLKQITDAGEIEKFVDEAIRANPKAVQEFREGKERAIGALVGFVMKKTGGQANPQTVNKLLVEKMKK